MIKIKKPNISPVNPVLTWNFGKDPALTAFFGLLGSKRTSGWFKVSFALSWQRGFDQIEEVF